MKGAELSEAELIELETQLDIFDINLKHYIHKLNP